MALLWIHFLGAFYFILGNLRSRFAQWLIWFSRWHSVQYHTYPLLGWTGYFNLSWEIYAFLNQLVKYSILSIFSLVLVSLDTSCTFFLFLPRQESVNHNVKYIHNYSKCSASCPRLEANVPCTIQWTLVGICIPNNKRMSLPFRS